MQVETMGKRSASEISSTNVEEEEAGGGAVAMVRCRYAVDLSLCDVAVAGFMKVNGFPYNKLLLPKYVYFWILCLTF